mgnify:CR=1 FL=1
MPADSERFQEYAKRHEEVTGAKPDYWASAMVYSTFQVLEQAIEAGFGKLHTPRAWLSTWSGLSSDASLVANVGRFDCPTLVVHPTADTEIRVRQAQEILANAGAARLQGLSAGSTQLMSAMFKAALKDFPQTGINPRRVSVQLTP